MDSASKGGLLQARIENSLPNSTVEELKIKFYMTKRDSENMLEHMNAQKALTISQKLASALADVLIQEMTNTPVEPFSAKIAITNNPFVDSESIDIKLSARTGNSSGAIIEIQKPNVEVLLLRQCNQILEDQVALLKKNTRYLEQEIKNLRQAKENVEGEVRRLDLIVENSLKQSKAVVARLRAATHARAGDFALQYGNSDDDYAQGKNHGSQRASDPAASLVTDREPEVFELNPKLKEIDFFVLEDMLNKDDADKRSSERPVKDFPEEDDDNVVGKATGSVSEVSFDDNATSWGHLSTRIFELPKGTPPTVLKTGLDVGIARAGGMCKAKEFYESPIHRHNHARDGFRKIVSYAELDNTARTDDDFPGIPRINDVVYTPSLKDGGDLKTAFIGNLPQNINYEKLLAKVRGGAIISATLCDTRTVAGCARRMSALVVFINSKSTQSYVEFARKHGIIFGAERAIVTLVNTPTHPLSVQAQSRIGCNHHTRYFMIREDGSNLDIVKIIRVINFEVSEYRKEAIEKAWKDEHGNVRILFASISAASNAHWKLTKRLFHDPSKVEFQDDPCAGPLTDLFPHGGAVNFVGPKLNYGFEDIEVDNSKPGKLVNPPTRSSAINGDEIDIENGNDEETVSGNKESEAESAKESSDKISMSSEKLAKSSNILTIKATESEAAAQDKLAQVENSKKILKSFISRCTTHTGTEDAPEHYQSSEGDDTLTEDADAKSAIAKHTIAENIIVWDAFAEDISTKESIADGSIAKDNITNESIVESTDAKGCSAHDDIIEDTVEFESHRNLPVTPDNPRSPYEQTPSAATKISNIPNSGVGATDKPGEKSKQSSQTSFSSSEESFPAIIGSPTAPNSGVRVSEKSGEKSEPSLQTSIYPCEKFSSTTAEILTTPRCRAEVMERKLSVEGTDLDRVLLPRFLLETAISLKPHGCLDSSRWADRGKEPAKTKIFDAPEIVPTMADARRHAKELLFGKSAADDDADFALERVPKPVSVNARAFSVTEAVTATESISVIAKPVSFPTEPVSATTEPASVNIETVSVNTEQASMAPKPISMGPANAPKGPCGDVSTSKWANSERCQKLPARDESPKAEATTSAQVAKITKSKETMLDSGSKPTYPAGLRIISRNQKSRYLILGSDTSQPRPTLRRFYSDVDAIGPKRY